MPISFGPGEDVDAVTETLDGGRLRKSPECRDAEGEKLHGFASCRASAANPARRSSAVAACRLLWTVCIGTDRGKLARRFQKRAGEAESFEVRRFRIYRQRLVVEIEET